MKFLLLNQCFHPDVMATGQQLTDLAVGLAKEGHEVTVVTSDRGYDDPSRRFPRRETWKGIQIIRIPSLALGKANRWRRGLNFGSFMASCVMRMLLLPRFDVVVALTSPPLISFLGAAFARLRGSRFYFWVMDLNPDEAIAAGWLRRGSLTSRVLQRLLHFSLARSERVIALDRFMKQRIVAKGISEDRVVVLPPWAHDDNVRFDEQGRESFRRQHRLEESFVVMYAGNHSPCHPLDTLMEAARRFSDRSDIAFLFVGGGSEQERVRAFALQHGLTNVRCLPYQSREDLGATLSAADLHTVVMGDPFVGIVHPSKVYNLLTIRAPFLYIGPEQSHVTEISAQLDASCRSYQARHDQVELVVNHILTESKLEPATGRDVVPELAGSFSKQVLLPRMIEVLKAPLSSSIPVSAERSNPGYAATP
jgi:colanic acid biosynthesis glycosyl transferase WcaI